MSSPKKLDSAIIEPISAEQPAGRDLNTFQEWADISKALREAREQEGETAVQHWRKVSELCSQTIQYQSKDLRIARDLLESLIHGFGFDGIHDGLWLFHQLLVRYWDSGLFPLIDNGDRSDRAAALSWLDQKLASEIRALPLTHRNGAAEEYSRLHFELAQNPNQDRITLAQFNDAMSATMTADLEKLDLSIKDALDRLVELNQLSMERFGPETVTYGLSMDAFKSCRKLIELNLAQRQPAGAGVLVTTDGSAAVSGAGAIAGLFGLGDASGGSWEKAEEMVRSGRIDDGVREMARLAATEANGRARFFRKLLLADVCMRTRREKLAAKILEELNEQIATYKLAEWETSEVVGAVLSRLYRLYAKENSETANPEGAVKLYDTLSRLDPWQAMSL